jgi:hypothetical protein
MGNFYSNFVVLDSKAEEVLAATEEMKREAYVIGMPDKMTVVCDERCDTQDTVEIERLGAALSGRFNRPVFGAMNHDDDHLLLWLFHRGAIARYESCADAFRFAWKVSRVRGGVLIYPLLVFALAWPIVIFQVFRHWMVAAVLALPPQTVGYGYDYIERGDFPQDFPDIKRK